MSTPDAAPPGWYADPYAQAPYRWFDGSAWTAHVHDGGPARPAAATAAPFVSDPGAAAATAPAVTAPAAAAAAMPGQARPQPVVPAVEPQPLGAVQTHRFGMPAVAPAASTTAFGSAPGLAQGPGYGAAATAYAPGNVLAGVGYAQPVAFSTAERDPLPKGRIVAGVSVLVAFAVVAALLAPHLFPRVAHYSLAVAPPATLAGAPADTSASAQAALRALRPVAEKAFAGLPSPPALVMAAYGAPVDGVAGERLVVVWAASSQTFPQDQAAPALVDGMRASGATGTVVTDATPDGGTFGCTMPQQVDAVMAACAWARSGTGFIIVYDVGVGLEETRTHTTEVVAELLG